MSKKIIQESTKISLGGFFCGGSHRHYCSLSYQTHVGVLGINVRS